VIHAHRAERADRLVAGLAELLEAVPVDALAPEVVSVPTRGVERWLAQTLSARLGARDPAADGICANIEFPFPGRLVGEAVQAATGIGREGDPWLVERLVWPLLDVVDAHLGEQWLSSLSAHLHWGRAVVVADESEGAGRRFSSVRHIADLFDRYGVHRPGMLRAWAAGDDTDGDGAPLPADVRWQAELWRRLREQVGTPSPAERLPGACRRLRDEPGSLELPERISLFGLTRLPASYLDVLEAVAAHREVHLFLLHPSPALWERVRPFAESAWSMLRAEDLSAEMPLNPLLGTWGRDAREMQLVLGGRPGLHDHRPLEGAPDTLLGRLQAGVRADVPPPGAPLGGRPDDRVPLDPSDRSLEVHACHGRGRQVEVVRDAILHALAEDPTLEPRDILVMCPDVESFAPLVQATFAEEGSGEDDAERTPDIRVRLADRSLRQTNPVLGVVAELLDLASARLTAAQVLDLAAREPVRRRFGLDDDDLARLDRWAAECGVRWGLDGAHRVPYGLEAVEANTWRSGLDRLLTGVAMAEEDGRLVGGVLPLDDVDSGAIDLTGRLAEFVERLGTALDALSVPRPVAGWAETLRGAADALCAVGAWDAWQREQLDRILEGVSTEASSGDPGSALSLTGIRALLGDRLRGRPTRANFRTGHLTVCTLVPMRSVPHRMICLMGLDDGAFPRHGAPDGDDILALDPRVGDRSVRGEDRQLLLDALMAATDRLVIAYSGRDERTNAPLPPAVPVGELLDVVDATVRVEEGRGGETVVVHHPLQPFDARNFTAGALGRPGPWGFDRAALAGARALETAADRVEPFLREPLPDLAGDLVSLDLLERFVAHPVRAFLRERLGVTVSRTDEGGDESIPIELDGLRRWAIGERFVQARLRGGSAEDARAAELARGTLPPDALGPPILATIETLAGKVGDAAAAFSCGGDARSLALDAALPGGRSLVGVIGGIGDDLIWNVAFSRLGPGHRLTAWVRFLALCAAEPDRPWRSVIVGRLTKGSKAGASLSVIEPIGHDAPSRRAAAVEQLAVLVDLLDRGMREPLPLYGATSAAYAAATLAGADPVAAAAAAWEGAWNWPGEGEDGPHALVLGGTVPFEQVLDKVPPPDESGPGWDHAEPTRFGRLALRLWAGLLAHEQVTDR
jgi:exodeoxyribonuclease V gamma subunit